MYVDRSSKTKIEFQVCLGAETRCGSDLKFILNITMGYEMQVYGMTLKENSNRPIKITKFPKIQKSSKRSQPHKVHAER